jgi:hypothetical protein
VTNAAGTVTSAGATLTVTVAPVITTQPVGKTVTAGGSATFSVTATGTAPLTYQWRFKGASLPGQTTDTLALSNVQTNQTGAYSVVVANNSGSVTSADAVLTVKLPTSPMTITVVGNGAVSPDLNGQALEIGQSYTLTATPAADSYFTGWSGAATETNTTVTFVMQPNMELQAVFAITPQHAAPGTYNGLFYESTGATFQRSGLLAMTLKDNGSFKGSVRIGVTRYVFLGTVGTDGMATASATSRGQAPLTVALQVVSTNGIDQIAGTIGDGTWQADVITDRAIFNASENPQQFAGEYNLALPSETNAPASGAGGSGTTVVDLHGWSRVKGKLANGAKLKQRVPVSKAGDLPLYVPLPGTNGALMGWLKVTGASGSNAEGQILQLTP